MFYAVLFVMVISGIEVASIEPVSSLPLCRAYANAINQLKDPTVGDARCVAIIPDKQS